MSNKLKDKGKKKSTMQQYRTKMQVKIFNQIR